jgi:hypothetical protein
MHVLLGACVKVARQTAQISITLRCQSYSILTPLKSELMNRWLSQLSVPESLAWKAIRSLIVMYYSVHTLTRLLLLADVSPSWVSHRLVMQPLGG